MLFGQVGQAADALHFFKNYFVTGDYAVAGTGLKNTGGVGAITMNGVPCTTGVGLAASFATCTTKVVSGATLPANLPADIVAAFLYWQTVETSPSPAVDTADPYNYVGKFQGVNGFFETNKSGQPNPIAGKLISSDSSASACWSTGSGQTLRVYRADVLRYLPFGPNPNDPNATVRLANGRHQLKLGTDSTGKLLPGVSLVEGASLVVVYRVLVPGRAAIAPLKAVVFYDGEFTLSRTQTVMTQNVLGFYQAAGSTARMTEIAGNGQASFNEVVKVNGDNIASRPFTGSAGANWDNPTYNLTDIDRNDSSYRAEVDVQGTSTCLTFAALVTSTAVVDSDFDGLLDVWEQKGLHLNTQVFPATFGSCADYPSEPCVNLPAMGASPIKPDIFMQIDWMHGTGDGTGGTDGKGTHTHMPWPAALTAVCQTFASHLVSLHFDVGNNAAYQGQPCIIPATTDAYGHLLTQGGNLNGDLDEAALKCTSTNTYKCEYNEPYSVLSFKPGFAFIKDGSTAAGIAQHFAHNRKDVFHYFVFGHALAGPFDPNTGLPQFTDPKTTSGVGDGPGGDGLITLGLWRSDIPTYDQVGSPTVQSGTLMHELGHNLNLQHAGWYRKPNCMPNYPSVMNYLYQTRGLTTSDGVEHIDYSYGLTTPLSETVSANSPGPLFPLFYKVRYYAPLGPSNSQGQAAQKHCDGTPLLNTDITPLVRSESPSVSTPDWFNGNSRNNYLLLDLNFDGVNPETFYDQPDWFSLNLQQIGGKPNAYLRSGDAGGWDFGGWDFGGWDFGGWDFGGWDFGGWDFGGWDFGGWDFGGWDFGGWDFGGWDFGGWDFGGWDFGDEDYITHVTSSVDPPPPPSPACPTCGLTGANEPAASPADVLLKWTSPSTGSIDHYNVYRCAVIAPATSCTPGAPAFKFKSAFAGAASPTATCTFSKAAPCFADVITDTNPYHAGSTCPAGMTCYNTSYTYVITSVYATGAESPYSNTASGVIKHEFVIANSAGSVVYGTANPVTSYMTYPDNGSVAGVSCNYGVTPPRNVGVYPVICIGPAVNTAGVGVTYNAVYLGYIPGTLTITQRPITVTAAASNKIYDGGLASPVMPTITTGTLAYSDTPVLTETYDNKNVGGTHVMTPAITISDGNGGGNYLVTPVTINTGIITVRPITITAAVSTKPYDGGLTSPSTPTITTGSLGAGDSATYTETYDNKNVGTTHVMTPAASISDGNNGNNYAVTAVTINTGIITARPITVTAAASAKVYDGGTTSTSTPTITTGSLAAGDSATYTETYDNKNVGTTHVVTPAASISDGNNGNNYAVTPVAINTGIITTRPITVTASASTKVYDGGVTSTSTSTLTLGSLANGDLATYTETYDNKNVGATHVMTPAASISDGNNGNNYAVTPVTFNTGIITARPITVTAAASTKPYDGGVSSPAMPTITAGSLATGDSAMFTETYDNPNAGITHVMTPAVSIGNGNGGNYVVTPVTIGGGIITQLPAMVTLGNLTQTATGGPLMPTVSTVPAGLTTSLTGAPQTAAGSYPVTATVTDPNFVGSANGTFVINNTIDLTMLARNGNAALNGSALRITQAAGDQSSSAWLPAEKVVSGAFSTTFTFQVAGDGDGFAFVIQAGNGVNAVGSTGLGQYLGYTGISNSIAVEFDTYVNADYGDPDGNHVGIQSKGTSPNSSDHTITASAALATPVLTPIANGSHTATITYDGIGILNVFMDGSATPTISASVNLSTKLNLDAGGTAFVGFTGATGAASETADILTWTWD
jgi:hypothetical protein